MVVVLVSFALFVVVPPVLLYTVYGFLLSIGVAHARKRLYGLQSELARNHADPRLLSQLQEKEEDPFPYMERILFIFLWPWMKHKEARSLGGAFIALRESTRDLG